MNNRDPYKKWVLGDSSLFISILQDVGKNICVDVHTATINQFQPEARGLAWTISITINFTLMCHIGKSTWYIAL